MIQVELLKITNSGTDAMTGATGSGPRKETHETMQPDRIFGKRVLQVMLYNY